MKKFSDAVDGILASRFDDGRSKNCRFPNARATHSTEREVTTVDVRGVLMTFYVTKQNAVCVFIWETADGAIGTETVELWQVIAKLEQILQAR